MLYVFFFNDTASTEIYTLSLHDALPIYQLAKKTLTANRDKLEVIAKALLEYETLDGSQIKEIVDHGRLINPPPGASPPPGKKMPAEKPPKQVVAAPDVTPPLPGALGGAPA